MSVGYLTKFGNNIRKYREQLNISQEELAERSGLHRTYVGSVERGERNIGLLNIVAISKALNVRTSNLMEAVDNDNGG